jgi:hypothetical protein
LGSSQPSTGSFSNAAARAALSGPASDGAAVRGELSVIEDVLIFYRARQAARPPSELDPRHSTTVV